jgi:hypothetical protein
MQSVHNWSLTKRTLNCSWWEFECLFCHRTFHSLGEKRYRKTRSCKFAKKDSCFVGNLTRANKAGRAAPLWRGEIEKPRGGNLSKKLDLSQ